jgi:hypothetical protein
MLFITSDTNNVIVSIFLAKNGVIDNASRIDRFIGTGADVGAGAVAGLLLLEPNDTIDLYFSADTDCDIVVEFSNVYAISH